MIKQSSYDVEMVVSIDLPGNYDGTNTDIIAYLARPYKQGKSIYYVVTNIGFQILFGKEYGYINLLDKGSLLRIRGIYKKIYYDQKYDVFDYVIRCNDFEVLEYVERTELINNYNDKAKEQLKRRMVT